MNILLRVRLAYRTLNEKGGHDYAAIYLSMIICIFYIGCWSLWDLLLPYKLTSFPFPVWAFLWLFLSVASVYFICIWKDGYVRANDFLNTIPQVQKKSRNKKWTVVSVDINLPADGGVGSYALEISG